MRNNTELSWDQCDYPYENRTKRLISEWLRRQRLLAYIFMICAWRIQIISYKNSNIFDTIYGTHRITVAVRFDLAVTLNHWPNYRKHFGEFFLWMNSVHFGILRGKAEKCSMHTAKKKLLKNFTWHWKWSNLFLEFTRIRLCFEWSAFFCALRSDCICAKRNSKKRSLVLWVIRAEKAYLCATHLRCRCCLLTNVFRYEIPIR